MKTPTRKYRLAELRKMLMKFPLEKRNELIARAKLRSQFKLVHGLPPRAEGCKPLTDFAAECRRTRFRVIEGGLITRT
jgi:hypothetical protein